MSHRMQLNQCFFSQGELCSLSVLQCGNFCVHPLSCCIADGEMCSAQHKGSHLCRGDLSLSDHNTSDLPHSIHLNWTSIVQSPWFHDLKFFKSLHLVKP